MWSLLGRSRPPPPPPPRRRLSKYKVRRFGVAAAAALLVCAAAILLLTGPPSPLTEPEPARESAARVAADPAAAPQPAAAAAVAAPAATATGSDTAAAAAPPPPAPAPAAGAAPDVLAAAPLDGSANVARGGSRTPATRSGAQAPDAAEAAARARRERAEYFAGFSPRAAAPPADGGAAGGDHAEVLYVRDFEGRFGVSVTNSCVVPLAARRRLKGHDIKQDGLYKFLKRSGRLASFLARYAPALERGGGNGGGAAADGEAAEAEGEENWFAVRMSPLQDKGYGLFAERDVPNGTVLGEYGGRYALSEKLENVEYAWDLPAFSIVGDNGEMRKEIWAIDATEMGNALRFCNDLGPGSWNVATRFVPLNGLWHVLYETIAPVHQGQEFSVSYGKAFWERRQQQAGQSDGG